MPWTDSPRTNRATALLLGAVSVAAFAPTGAFPVIWLSLAGLFALLTRLADTNAPTRDGAILGICFGAGFFLSGVSWVYVSLSIFGGMPAPVAGLATLLFCVGMSLYPALAGALFVRFAPVGWRRALFFAAAWTLTEWLRGWFLTGFPWLAAGYSQTPPSPLAGFAPIVGVYGVSLLTALVGGLFSLAIQPATRWKSLGAIAVLLLSGFLLLQHTWTSPHGEPVRVALLQGNVAQDLKWRPEKFEESLRTYHQLMHDAPAQLTVLPETALPVFLDQVPPDYLEALTAVAARQRGDLLFGIVTGDRHEYANSAVSLGASGEQRYDKSHLVPFGEFIPPGFAWFMAMANIPMSEFTRGAKAQKPMRLAGLNAAINICYEDAFGEEIIRALPEADVLINISNVAWFGDSLAPPQHLQIARMRALETGRMMLRATNTGMTAIVGADGRVHHALPPFTRAALSGEVRAYSGSTPYVRWGNGPIVVVAVLILCFMRRRNALS